jgi:multimeric flavodoxin WrbA
MRISILNGEPDPGSAFEVYLHDLAAQLRARGHILTTLDLRELDLKGCSGCWGCWVKTPGKCLKRDDHARVCRAVLDSDLCLWASPVARGFTSTLLKRAADQMIPLIHPYLVMEGGEMHHRPRYAHYPKFGLVLGPGADTDAEDLEITTAMWARTARNFKSRLALSASSALSVREVVDAIAAVA